MGFALVAMTMAAILSAACQRPSTQKTSAEEKPIVRVEEVKTSSIDNYLDVNGYVEAERSARIASPAEGPITNCAFREGDRVRKGERILSLGRNASADAQLEAAKADLAREQEELKRVERLVEVSAIPRDELDRASANYARALSQLAKARESVEDYSIRAPWDGIISKMLATDGDFVAARTPLLEMYDPSSIIVRFSVSENYAANLKKGIVASITFDAFPGQEFKGIVNRVHPALDPRTKTRTAEAVVEGDEVLFPGMFARMRLILETIPDATIVPSESVITMPNGNRMVFVVQGDKAIRREIRTGLEDVKRTQVLEGLSRGEMVVVAGHQKLKDGMAVDIKKREEPGKPGDNKSAGAVQ